MLNSTLISPCGLNCGECQYFGKSCNGCNQLQGKPFWTSQLKMDVCPIYDCCKNNYHFGHCGWCEHLPCTIFLELKDPALSDDEFEESLRRRVTVLHDLRQAAF